MDFNNVESRLRRLNSALDQSIRDASDQDVHITVGQLDGTEVMQVRFGELTDEQAVNNGMAVLGQVANLKDILKKSLLAKGLNKSLVEEMIDDCFELQLIIDLVNAEKHGYPTTSNRSGRNPKVHWIRQAKNFNDNSIELCGRIIDENDEWIIDYEDMVEKAVRSIEECVAANSLA